MLAYWFYLFQAFAGAAGMIPVDSRPVKHALPPSS